MATKTPGRGRWEETGALFALRERNKDLKRQLDELRGAVGILAKRAVHGDDCRAYKVIGRFGSRSGLRWTDADSERCDCGLSQVVAKAKVSP